MSQGLTPLVISQALLEFYKSEQKRKRSSPTDVTVCNFADKRTFYCVVSILLCRAPWTVVALTWEMGLVVSLGSISQLVVSLIQSSAMVLAMQYQGCSSRGLLCEERKGVIILRPPNHGEVTGFASLGFLILCGHEAWDWVGLWIQRQG